MRRVRAHRGDDGRTDFPSLGRVAKSHPLLEACGSLDELNCVVGELAARVEASSLETIKRRAIVRQLRRIQGELFLIGSILSGAPGRTSGSAARVRTLLRRLESEVKAMGANLTPCRGFILPGDNLLTSAAHLARAVCRRAERNCVAAMGLEMSNGRSLRKNHGQDAHVMTHEPRADAILPYLNRLGHWLFVLARRLSQSLGRGEIASSGLRIADRRKRSLR